MSVNFNFEDNIAKKKPDVRLDITFVKVFYTIAIMINHLGYGLGNSIVGPSLIDLQYVFDVPEESMNNGPLLIMIGYVFGALTAGQLSGWVQNRQILMAAFMLPMAMVNFFILNVPFPVALVLYFVFGAGLGANDSCSSMWIVELWPHHNPVILPCSTALFGAGQILGPIILAPYVFGEDENKGGDERRIFMRTPYLLCATIQVIVPLLYIILNFTQFRYNTPRRVQISTTTNSISKDPRLTDNPYRMYQIVIAGIAVSAAGSAEQGWSSFASSMFQHFGDNMFDAHDAARLFALWSGAFAFGLLMTAVIATKLTPDSIIAAQFVIVFVALSGLFIGHHSKVAVYIFTIVFGLGISSMWSMKFAFVERHFKLTDLLASGYTVLFGSFSIVVPILLQNTAKENPLMLIIILLGFLGIAALAFLVVKFWLLMVYRKNRARKLQSNQS